MARARGANAIMAAAYELTYGTVPGSGFKKLPFVSADIGEDQALIASRQTGADARRLGPPFTNRPPFHRR